MERLDHGSDDAFDSLESAWEQLHAATPPGWFVGRPGERHGGQWAMYAFDTTEKALIGRRSREWTAVGQTEEERLREVLRSSP